MLYITFIYLRKLHIRDINIRPQPSTLPSAPASSHFSTSVLAAPQWLLRRLSSGSVSSGGVSGSSVSGSGGIGDGKSGSGIFHSSLSLVVNLRFIVRIDLNGASAATKAPVAALEAASKDGGV